MDDSFGSLRYARHRVDLLKLINFAFCDIISLLGFRLLVTLSCCFQRFVPAYRNFDLTCQTSLPALPEILTSLPDISTPFNKRVSIHNDPIQIAIVITFTSQIIVTPPSTLQGERKNSNNRRQIAKALMLGQGHG